MTDEGRIERARWERWGWRLGVVLTAGVTLWLLAWSSCLRSDLVLPVVSDRAGVVCALEWRRAGNDAFNGVWVNLSGDATRPIERRLPAYVIDDLRLRAPAELPASALGKPVVVVRLFGAEIARREGVVRPASSTDAPSLEPPVIAQIDVDTGAPWWSHVVGVVVACMACGVLWAGFVAVCAGARALRDRAWKWRAVVAGAVVGVHLWAAAATPIILTGDAVIYLAHAARMARSGWLGDAGAAKSPLFSAMLALPLALGADPLAWARVVLVATGVLCPLLVFWTLRRLTASEPAALIGALLCGLNPLLITMEGYLLRESMGACLLAGMALVCTRVPASRPMRLAGVLGLLAGLGALLRENFQTLIALVPIAILFMPGWSASTGVRGIRARVAPAAVALAVALVCVSPWYALQYSRFGKASMTLPKVNLNKALNQWSNDVYDLNQTGVVSAATWADLARRNAELRFSDYGAVYGPIDATDPFTPSIVRERPKPAQPILTDGEAAERAAWIERITGVMVEESAARGPESVWRGRAVSFLSLTGLWIFPDHPAAASLEWFSRPLRRAPQSNPTNIQFPPVTNPGYRDIWKDVEPFIQRHEVSFPQGTSLAFARWFDCLFMGNQLLRPPLAALAIAACVAAWRRRSWPILAVGVVIAGNLVGAAWVVATAADRVAAPFIPGMIVMAVWVVWMWREGETPRRVVA